MSVTQHPPRLDMRPAVTPGIRRRCKAAAHAIGVAAEA